MRHDDNLTADLPNFVTHLECAMTGERHEADQVHNLSRAGKPLLVRYDLAGVKKALTKEKLAARPADLWRYRELLPVRRKEDIVSLGEAATGDGEQDEHGPAQRHAERVDDAREEEFAQPAGPAQPAGSGAATSALPGLG